MDDIGTRPKAKISAGEMERRRKALRQADAGSRLEGQFRSPASEPIFEAFIQGEIEMDEILPRLKALDRRLWAVPGYTLEDGITVKNKLGATDHDELEAKKADYVSNRLLQFELGHGPAGQFDAAHLKAIHHHLFQDVYEWAGRTRDEKVSLSDGTVATEPVLRKLDGKPFLTGRRIATALDRIAAR
jgi:hypothetical protein